MSYTSEQTAGYIRTYGRLVVRLYSLQKENNPDIVKPLVQQVRACAAEYFDVVPRQVRKRVGLKRENIEDLCEQALFRANQQEINQPSLDSDIFFENR